MPSAFAFLLGTAVGDALGLPYENLSPRRARKLLGEPVRYRLLFGRGMVSDDTEHACLTAQALVRSGLDPERFGHELAWSLRWWVLGIPAGAGSATLRAAFRLWLGFGFRSSGVRSAGNGPSMRSAILGAAVDDLDACLLEQTGDAARQPPDNAVLPVDGATEIDGGRGDGDAELVPTLGHAANHVEFIGRMDQRLGGDAADGETGAAGLAHIDDDGVDAQLSRADGADIAARASADDQKLAGDLFHGISFR